MKKNKFFFASLVFVVVSTALGVTCKNNSALDTQKKCEKESECKWVQEGEIGYCTKK